MDSEDPNNPRARTRTSSFRSTHSGFVHPSGIPRSPSSHEETGSNASFSHTYSPVKHFDNHDLSLWKSMLSSLDSKEESSDLYSKPVRDRHGDFGRSGGRESSGARMIKFSRPPANTPVCVPIGASSAMDLLFDHLKHDTTDQMTQFLKEKACIIDEDEQRNTAGPSSQAQVVRGVKRPVAAVDSPWDELDDEDEGMAA